MDEQHGRDVAIIGMACRFPQANHPGEFWDNLKAGRECISAVPSDRWPAELYYDPRRGTPGKSISKWGGFLDDVRGFDAAFFGISPGEAAVMDPQHRLLLEMAYEALESAGYGDERRRQGLRVGVFIGISHNGYEEFTRPLLFDGRPVHPAMLADNLRNLAAGRIAYTFDLNGPTLALDTACSSSLVALHYARLSLGAGECDLALVGGINLNLTATAFVAFSSAGALSASPHLYLFDERADGFVLGEGGGMVLIRPVAQAAAAGDPVLAVVKGSAVNNDGRSLGPMAPNPAGQQAVMAEAYGTAGLEPATISYIEAHGTGTRIGDAVEVRSLGRIFPAGERPRYVGSVKSNIGHLLSGAGMGSLIKVVLALQARQIPPSLNCDRPRANLRMEHAGLVVNQQVEAWPGPGPRRAGINAFGFGGTNAHVILEEAPERVERAATARPSALWLISAPTQRGLARSATALAGRLQAMPWSDWPDVCYSASTARPAFAWRAALAGYGGVPARLAAIAGNGEAADGWQGQVVSGRPPRIAFWLTGEAFAGQPLYHEEPAFRRLYGKIVAAWGKATVPAGVEAVAAQLALAWLLMEWGVRPDAVIGVGRGEVVAAVLAGRLPLAALPELVESDGELIALTAGEETIPWFSAANGDWIKPDQQQLIVKRFEQGGAGSGLVAGRLVAAGMEVIIALGPAGQLAQVSVAGNGLRVETLFGKGVASAHELYGTLGRWWVGGLPLDRQAMEADWPSRRVPVPTYPFEHVAYWVDGAPERDRTAAPTATATSSVQHWLHQIEWHEYPIPEAMSKTETGRIVIVATRPEPANRLLAGLRGDGVATEVVEPAGVAEALARGGAAWLVYLDSLTDAGAGDETEGVRPCLQVAQAVARVAPAQRPQAIVVFTAGAQRVGAGDVPVARRAMVAGLAAALNDEIGITSLVVDLDPAGGVEEQVAAMVGELKQRPEAAVIAWRQGKRFGRSIGAGPAVLETERSAVRPDGVYLLVGGAGGIGAEIARRLTLEVAPTLILAGRTPLSQSAERTALLEKLRWAGARADYVACDVSDPAQVAALVKGIGRQYGRLTGVIFAAGTIRPGRLAGKTAGQFQVALAAKVRGVPLLWQAIERQKLAPEFFVVFSSVVSAVPGLAGGLGDYAAANAYLDAFAWATPGVTSVNWTIWAEAGQGANGAILEHLARAGIVGIGSAEAYQVLKAVVAHRPAQVVVVNREALSRPVTPRVERSVEQRGVAVPAGVAVGQTAEGVDAIRLLLQELLAGELEKEAVEVPVDESFAGLGLDSMAALDLVSELERQGFGRLPATLFFEYNTVEKLAHYLVETGSTPAGVGEQVGPVAEEEARPFDLSPVQLAFYTAHHIRPDAVAYAFVRQTVRGPLDKERLQEAVNRLVARHPMLRVAFVSQPGSPVPQQMIRPADAPGVTPMIEWLPPVEAVEPVEDRVVNGRLEIMAGEIMRVAVAPVLGDPDEWHLLLHLHHIAADGWSLNVLAQELWLIYSDLLNGRSPILPPPASHYREYVQQAKERATEAARAFWQERLAEMAQTPLALPYDGSTEGGGEQRALRFTAEGRLSEGLKQRAAEQDVSLFHLLLAVYYHCLGRWTGQERLVIGVAEAGRDYPLADIQRIAGCMADVFPLHLELKAGELVVALARRVRDAWLVVSRHLQLSSVELGRLRPDGAAEGEGRLLNPATFSFARFPAALPADAPIVIEDVCGRTATAVTRLSLVCWEFGGQLHFTWNYPTDLFRIVNTERFATDFLAVLEAVAAGGVGEDWGRTAGVVVDSFMEQIGWQCERNREGVAIDDGRRCWRYGEVDTLSGQLAARLAETGVGEGAVVGFLGEPAAEGIVALLAVMKLGATWLPLEPEYPAQRLRLMVAQAGAKVLLYAPEVAAKAAGIGDGVTTSMAVTLTAGDGPVRPAVPLLGERIAYIIFTSGSTGEPKGVPITYGALDHYLKWARACFAYSPADVVMEATALGFDASLRQCLVPLMSGAAVVPIGRDVARDPRQLASRLVEAGVTVWSSVPSLWLHLLAYLERAAAAGQLPDLARLRLVQLGGEALAAGAVRRWYDLFGGRAQLANLYGPTETTINASYYLVPGRPEAEAEGVPIGYARPGVTLLVVDEDGEACPSGRTGELLVGGVGLSPGYLNDGVLTGRKFVTLPVRPGERFFRTGDLVVQRPDGCLVFVGRNDNQVKVRGNRIELGEIEAVLASHPAVSQAAVVAVPGETPPAMTIVAFWEGDGSAAAGETLPAFLRQTLPEVMIPQRWQWLAQLSLLPNGKVDRPRLVELSRNRVVEPAGPDDNVALMGEIEAIVAEVWEEVLGVRPRRREDDFFALGGDSLNILAVLVALEQRGLTVPSAAELYRHRTLAGQAQVLQWRTADVVMGEAAAEVGAPFPLSPAQVGFLMTRSFAPPLSTTWMARFCLDGRLDLALFEEALRVLFQRHAMLRTVCLPGQRPPLQKELAWAACRTRDEGRPGQVGDKLQTYRTSMEEIAVDGSLPLRYEDLREEIEAAGLEAALNRRQEEEQGRVFDLAQWPLIQMRLCRVADERHYWFIAADHFMGDGLSGWLFGCELIAVYDRLVEGKEAGLRPLRATFRDYVMLALEKEKQIGAETVDYWRGVFERPYVNPQEWYRPAEEADGEWLHQVLELDAGQYGALKAEAAKRGQTAHDWLLALFARQLGRLTGRADLVVGTANAGRDYALPDLMAIFGSFATLLPVRMYLDPTADRRGQIEAAVAAFERARAHKLAPGQIARLAGSGGSLAAVTGLQFFFSFMDFERLGRPDGKHLAINWELSQTELQPPRLGTDVVLAARALKGRLRLTFTAGAHALDKAGLAGFVAAFQEELVGLLRPVDRPRTGRVTVESLDAALVAYLPPAAEVEGVLAELGIAAGAEAVRGLLFAEGASPRLVETVATGLGRTGTVCIPRFADELAGVEPATLAAEVAAAVEVAAGQGVRCVSLAGMLPAHTRYGFGVLEAMAGQREVALTTGHSLTVVAVVKTVQHALAVVGYRPADLCLAVVGVGSIGGATLGLYLAVAEHPRRIILCDRPGSRDRLHQLAATLCQREGYRGEIEIVESGDGVPAEVYTADLIVGAASQANILAVDRLRPGSVVVDDSFPHCFDRPAAVARMRREKDVLLVGGGLLDCGPVERQLHLPPGAPAGAERVIGYWPAAGSPGCQLESLLRAYRPDLPLTYGLVTVENARAYWQAVEAVGWRPARLHLGNFLPGDLPFAVQHVE